MFAAVACDGQHKIRDTLGVSGRYKSSNIEAIAVNLLRRVSMEPGYAAELRAREPAVISTSSTDQRYIRGLWQIGDKRHQERLLFLMQARIRTMQLNPVYKTST